LIIDFWLNVASVCVISFEDVDENILSKKAIIRYGKVISAEYNMYSYGLEFKFALSDEN
jgi:hypothetical protein